jgi:hypothetical protein
VIIVLELGIRFSEEAKALLDELAGSHGRAHHAAATEHPTPSPERREAVDTALSVKPRGRG